MTSNKKFLKEELLTLIEKKKHLPTICEGKRDLIALRALGFTNLMELNAPLFEVVERFEKGTKVQLLVDLDREGRKLYSALKSDFSQRGVRIDDEVRELLFKTELRQIEGLNNYMEDKNV